MTILIWGSGLCLFAAAVLTVVKIVRGPTVLNRALATDLLVTILICTIGLKVAATDDKTPLAILFALSLVAFVGSVAVARFVHTGSEIPEECGPTAVSNWTEER